MTPLEIAVKLQAVFEGCKLEAYWDKYGKVWTIGYGHTRGVSRGMKITREKAQELLAEDTKPLANMVSGPKYTVIQQGALISFGHNCGIGALARVLGGNITITKEGFMTTSGLEYGNTSGGVELSGLVARRELEAALFLS